MSSTSRLLSCLLLTAAVRAQQPKDQAQFPLNIPLGLIEPDIPRSAPLTRDRVELGRKLFFDTGLSKDARTSCATCHDPAHGFAEPVAISVGAAGRKQKRNAPTLYNVGFLSSFMWDGRFSSLEAQATDPFTTWGDMGIELEEVLGRINASREYQDRFTAAYGSRISAEHMADAIASFERTLLSGNSRFDHFLYGNDPTALSPSERGGYELFIGRASCVTCHDIFHPDVNPLGGGLATFTDQRYHNIGVGYANGRMQDVGRYQVTRDPLDWGAFKTPSLRNVVRTGPYMHDGSLATLADVVDFYNRGGNPNPNLSPGLKPLFLTKQDQDALIAFLEALTDPRLPK